MSFSFTKLQTTHVIENTHTAFGNDLVPEIIFILLITI